MRFDPQTATRTVELDGYPLALLEQGEGQALLLVHGSLCDYRYWQPQMAPLARRFRVIAPSLRHYWPAASGATDGSFSVARHAADLLALASHLGLERFHLVGHSRGARVALEAALQAPGRMLTLTLADPGVQFADAPAASARPAFVQEAMRALADGDVETALARFVDAVNGADTWRRMVAGFKQMARDNAVTLFGQAIEPAAPLADAALRGLACPTLLIGGAASPRRYVDVQDRLQALLPDVRRIVIPGAAHGMNLAKPHSFNTALAGFAGGPA